MRWMSCGLVGVALMVMAAGAHAQDSIVSPVLPESVEDISTDAGKIPWRTSWFPFITGRSNDGPMLSVRLRHWQPADYEARTTFTGAFDGDAGITAQGSRYVRAEFEAPLLWKRWRFLASAMASREARFGYYGLGNDATFDDDLVTDDDPYLYRVKRTRYRGRAEASRYLSSRLLLSLAGEFESTRFAPLPGPTTFDADFGDRALSQDDATARVALILDTRDVEYNTRRGVLLEAGAQAGSGGDGYTRLYTVLRAYLPVREGTILAARFAASGMGGTPTLNARYTIPSWERTIAVLGGESSHRSLDAGRFAGRHVMFGNVEVRHDVLHLGDLGALTLVGFADAGRVFETERFSLTTDDLHVGGGGGIAVRILRSTIFGFNFAGGPDGFNFSVGNGWMF